MKEVPLTQGKVALVDDQDFEKVSAYSWSAHTYKRNWYAKAVIPGCPGARLVPLHRFLLGFPTLDVDPRDGDGLNCQRDNLRLATVTQNCANARKTISQTTSKFKGVSRCGEKWRAYIAVAGQQRHLGVHLSEVEAAEAYNRAARLEWGEFARLNAL